MWLLNVNTTEIEYFSSSKPPYAILSHTWNRGQEVTFDMLQGSSLEYQKLSGWAKIQQCCNQARDDGWEYVWVDTCCINKKDSAELSEAINSMFEWYRKAAVCYAYLEDHHSNSNEIAGCRWFTRGWTLQELIAPLSIFFFDSNWSEIGSRDSLASAISEATNIGVKYLTRGDLFRSASVSEKFSWAARRTTERAEDEAYCLLGLFEIHMPLIYGEQERAFDRLQKAILEKQNDETIFAWLFTNRNPENVRGGMLGFLAQRPSQFKDCGGLVPHIYDDSRTELFLSKRGLQICAHVHNSSSKKLHSYVMVLNIAHLTSVNSCPRYFIRMQDKCLTGKILSYTLSGPSFNRSGLPLDSPLRTLYEQVPSYVPGFSSYFAPNFASEFYCNTVRTPTHSRTRMLPVKLSITAREFARPTNILIANGSVYGDWVTKLDIPQANETISCGNVCMLEDLDYHMFLVLMLELANGEQVDVVVSLHWKGLVNFPSWTVWQSTSRGPEKDSFERLKRELATFSTMNPVLRMYDLLIKARVYPVPTRFDTSNWAHSTPAMIAASEPALRVHIAFSEAKGGQMSAS